jgi:hypothetical protein
MQPQRIETTEPKTTGRPSPQAMSAVARQFGRPLVVGQGVMALGAGLPATPEMLARLEAGWSFDQG